MTSGSDNTQSQSTSPAVPRPGLQSGVTREFTIMCKLKPGMAPKMREVWAKYDDPEMTKKVLEDIGTLHYARQVLFDNDTRFLFASEFDGDWDTYIDDFGETITRDIFDEAFSLCEGFPGINDPNVKDWFAANGVTAGLFRAAYPDLTVQQIWKDQRVNEAFQAVLDTPEFQ